MKADHQCFPDASIKEDGGTSYFKACISFPVYTYDSCANNKQLLDEVEHDIMNYQNRGLCNLPKPKAEADNTDTRF